MRKLLAAVITAGTLFLSLSCDWPAQATVTTTVFTSSAPAAATTSPAASLAPGTHLIPTALPDLTAILGGGGPVEMRRGSVLIAAEPGAKVWHSPQLPGISHVSLTLLSYPMTQGQAPATALAAPTVVVTTYLDLPASSGGGTRSHSFTPLTTKGVHTFEFEATRFDVSVTGYGNAEVVAGYTAIYPAQAD